MQLTLTSDWEPRRGRGQDESEMEIAGLKAFVWFDVNAWAWAVVRSTNPTHSYGRGWVKVRADHTDDGAKEEAKAAAEETIRKVMTGW